MVLSLYLCLYHCFFLLKFFSFIHFLHIFCVLCFFLIFFLVVFLGVCVWIYQTLYHFLQPPCPLSFWDLVLMRLMYVRVQTKSDEAPVLNPCSIYRCSGASLLWSKSPFSWHCLAQEALRYLALDLQPLLGW